MNADLVGFLALALALATGAVWFKLIQDVAVPRDRTPYLAAMGAAAALGVLAFAMGTGLLGGIPAGIAILLGVVFIGLWLQRKQDAREPAIAVGGPMLDFTALDEHGAEFHLSSLRGRPILLKFFRGHW